MKKIHCLSCLFGKLKSDVKHQLALAAARLSDEDEVLLFVHQLFECLVRFVKKSHLQK